MKVYQPMSGLHRPVVVDPRLPNFRDTRLDVHCVPGDLLSRHEAGGLCQKVRLLFEHQGAQVTTHVAAGRPDDDPSGAPTAPDDAAAARPIALTLELRARQVHASNHPLSWVLCLATFTVLPGIQESTFAQDVVIRDESGFLLVSESLQGRIVRRFGAGTWAGNALLDLWREEEDDLTGNVASRDLSADLYRQLSQLTFNARMHAEVLRDARPLSRRSGAE